MIDSLSVSCEHQDVSQTSAATSIFAMVSTACTAARVLSTSCKKGSDHIFRSLCCVMTSGPLSSTCPRDLAACESLDNCHTPRLRHAVGRTNVGNRGREARGETGTDTAVHEFTGTWAARRNSGSGHGKAADAGPGLLLWGSDNCL